MKIWLGMFMAAMGVAMAVVIGDQMGEQALITVTAVGPGLSSGW